MANTAVKPVEPAVDYEAIKKEVADNPIILFMDSAKLDAYVEALRAEVALNPGDVSTAKGRDLIKGNAAEIGRKKSAFERERLRTTEEWRSNIATVNAAGKVVKDRLQALQDATRAPLTAWEEREASRRAEADAIVADMKAATLIQVGDTADALRERLERIRGRNLSDDMFGPRIEEVTDLRDETVSALLSAIDRVEQEERDRAELARLREEREQREREEAARRQREEAEAAEAERQRIAAEHEAQRQAAEAARAERERQEAVEQAERQAREAAEREAREAEARAQAERERIQREHDAAIAEANRRAEEAERAAQAERDRVAREKAAQEEAARLAAEEQARKAADLSHRAAIKDAARDAIIAVGIPALKADKLVQAITAGDIPHVSIAF